MVKGVNTHRFRMMPRAENLNLKLNHCTLGMECPDSGGWALMLCTIVLYTYQR